MISDSLRHVSSVRVRAIRDIPQWPHAARKPMGLWCSARDAWSAYLAANPKAKRYRRQWWYDVTLTPGARILRLDTPSDVTAFTATHGLVQPHVGTRAGTCAVDWAQIADAYDGVWVGAGALDRQGRPRFDWIDIDWAIPSGCVWSAGAISSITLVPSPAPTDRRL